MHIARPRIAVEVPDRADGRADEQTDRADGQTDRADGQSRQSDKQTRHREHFSVAPLLAAFLNTLFIMFSIVCIHI